MKKLLFLSAAVFALAATPVLADGHGDKGKKFEKHDVDGDGVISEDEFVTHAKERFSNMDADGDGKISQEEAKAAHKERRAMMKDKIKERKEKRDAAAE